MNKIKHLWNLAVARSYILVTDRMGAISLPYIDPYALDSIIIIGAQQIALQDMKDRLDGIIEQHEDRIKQLSHKEDK